jgi:hypothetical protein
LLTLLTSRRQQWRCMADAHDRLVQGTTARDGRAAAAERSILWVFVVCVCGWAVLSFLLQVFA